MYINPFAAGALAVIAIEVGAIFVAAAIKAFKNR